MNPPTRPEDAPGHDGAGHGEQVPEGAVEAPIATDGAVDSSAPGAGDGATSAGDDGAPVVFTPDDVHVPPPDRPPTENAPESEKAGLIFERS